MIQEFAIINFKRFRLSIVSDARIETLYTGLRLGEGPVYFADGDFLLFSDIPNNRIMRWVEGAPVTTYRLPSNNANGNTRDRQGRLVTCEQGGRRITRTEHDGSITVIVDNFDGKRLNSPNDIVVKSDDTIWFSDPDYGILSNFTGNKAKSEIGKNNVFRFDPKIGKLAVAIDDMDKPNGLAFSPDEKILYVADSGISHRPDGPHHIVAFDLVNGWHPTNRRVFAEVSPGVPDGLRVDTEGNVWTSAGDGVYCYASDGELIGKIHFPDVVTNLTFGGPKRNRLFVTAISSLYSVFVGQSGAQRP